MSFSRRARRRYMTGQSIYADGGNTVGIAAHTLEALTRQ
jgi:hypothetical protein